MTVEDVVKRCAGYLRRCLPRLTGDREEAEDLSQIVLWKCCDYFRDRGLVPPVGYVWRVARNAFCSRRRKRFPHPLPESLDESGEAVEQSPLSVCEDKERSAAIWAAVDTLRSLDQDLMKLYYLDGWSHREIAEAKGLGLEAVKTRIHRARVLLKDKLRRFGPD
jgi:RNA polymerase sigma-70 factor (ECF subfamily)